jgi:hypothetical protein
MRNYARLLFHHFLKIEQVEGILEPARQLIEEITSFEGTFPWTKTLTGIDELRYGRLNRRYTGSVEL